MPAAPDPTRLHPVDGQKRVVFLKALVAEPRIEVGEYTYYQALVLPGGRIGHGAIVAAASVVSADVPPYAIVAGNPARVVRRRYDDDDVGRLLRAAWWDWPIGLVTEHARAIMAGTPAQLEPIAAAAGGA